MIAIRKPEGEVKRRIIFNGHCDSAYEWRYTYLGGGHLLVAVIAIAIVGLVVTLVCEIAALATGHAMTAFEGGFWKVMAMSSSSGSRPIFPFSSLPIGSLLCPARTTTSPAVSTRWPL